MPLARGDWHPCLCLVWYLELSLEVEELKAVVELVDVNHAMAYPPETNRGQQRTQTWAGVLLAAFDLA